MNQSLFLHCHVSVLFKVSMSTLNREEIQESFVNTELGRTDTHRNLNLKAKFDLTYFNHYLLHMPSITFPDMCLI